MLIENNHQHQGPLETGNWPEHLTARVVTPGCQPRISGYDVEADLAGRYTYSDLLYLSLTGELPVASVSHAFSVTLAFLMPLSVAHAPTHAAVLSKLCGASNCATIGVAAVGLAAEAHHCIELHRELFAWLEAPTKELPAKFQSREPSEAQAVGRLRTALGAFNGTVAGLSMFPTRLVSLFCTLHACGLRTSEQLEAVLVVARLPISLAEGVNQQATQFREYPINLPPFRYTEVER